MTKFNMDVSPMNVLPENVVPETTGALTVELKTAEAPFNAPARFKVFPEIVVPEITEALTAEVKIAEVPFNAPARFRVLPEIAVPDIAGAFRFLPVFVINTALLSNPADDVPDHNVIAVSVLVAGSVKLEEPAAPENTITLFVKDAVMVPAPDTELNCKLFVDLAENTEIPVPRFVPDTITSLPSNLIAFPEMVVPETTGEFTEVVKIPNLLFKVSLLIVVPDTVEALTVVAVKVPAIEAVLPEMVVPDTTEEFIVV